MFHYKGDWTLILEMDFLVGFLASSTGSCKQGWIILEEGIFDLFLRGSSTYF